MVFERLKKSISGAFSGGSEDLDYVEIDLGKEMKKAKVIVRPFVLKSYEDVNPILNALREGYTIAIIDFKPLKAKDIIELKRAISKIKKTVDALEGSISGFGDSIILATPEFAEIYKHPIRRPVSAQDMMREEIRER